LPRDFDDVAANFEKPVESKATIMNKSRLGGENNEDA